MTAKPLILVDGSSYLYRAFYALPDLRTKDNRPTGAINGIATMLLRLQKSYVDSPVVVIFDAKGKTFRDDLYSEYKAQRPPMPDDLRAQVEPIHQMIELMGFPLIIHPGVEADDVIGTLATKASKEQRPVIIASNDKDMAQLVDDQVSIYNPMNNSMLDRQGVIDKFGIPPERIIDYLAIIGDKVDNIPGVPGIGEKSAVPILKELGGLEAIYANLDAIHNLDFRGASKASERMAQHRDLAWLSKKLATLKLDLELDIDSNGLSNQPANKAQLTKFYESFQLNRLLSQLQKDSTQPSEETRAPQSTSAGDYQCIQDKDHWQHWVQRIKQCRLVAFDTETTSIHAYKARLVGFSVAVTAGEAAYIPLAHDYLGAPPQLSMDTVLGDLKQLLEDPDISIIGQNLKYDMSVLRHYDISLAGDCYDSMLESYILTPSSRHDLDTLAQKYLNYQCTSYSDIAGKGKEQLTFNEIDLKRAAKYAAEDADISLRLHQHFWPQIEADPKLLKVYRTIEWPLVPVLSLMEMNGTRVDDVMLRQQSNELAKAIEVLQQQVHQQVGHEFNLSSTKQLREVLYDQMKLPQLRKTPKGAPSTAEDVLQTLALKHPLPKLILEFRTLSKLKSTYTDKLPQMIFPKTQRIHTSYHQAGTSTGRLSSSDPNLQNIPIRTEEGRRIRTAFIADSGNKIVAADYSQIELRIMAHLSADPNLLSAFAHQLDVHTATASEVFNVGLDEVNREQRRRAKAINFGLMYGMSAFGLAKQLGESRPQAQHYIDLYFKRYPRVQQFMDEIRKQARQQGYVETLFGRYLPVINIKSNNSILRKAAERAAINAPMQGSAADIIKLAMLDIDQWLRQDFPTTRLTLQVHDELVFEVPEADLDAVVKGIKLRMERVATNQLSVPLIVDINVGNNWNEAH